VIHLRPVGFYRRFTKKFSKIFKPLCDLLAKDVPFDFTPSCLAAFERLNTEVTSAPIIRPPDLNLLFEAMCNAFDYMIGVVPGQRVDRLLHIICYASKTLNDAQLNYFTNKKELAVVFTLDKFCPYLISSKVLIYTDHAVLKYLLTKMMLKPV